MNSAVVIKEPVGKKGLVYNENPQELVEPGEADGGVMQYALGTQKEPTGNFSEDIPTAENAGKYYVWYKIAGDASHEDILPQYVGKTVTIAPMPVAVILKDMTIKVGETGVLKPTLDVKIPVRFTFESWTEDVASVNEDGVVTGLKKGRGLIEVNANLIYASSNFKVSDTNVAIVNVVSDTSESDAVEPDASESDTIDIGQAIVELSESTFAYNGKVQKPSIKTIKGLKLTAGKDYAVTWSDDSSKNAGTYTVTVTGKGKYTGTTTATYTITKAENTLSVKSKSNGVKDKTKIVKVRYCKLKKRSKTLKAARLMTFANKGQGTKTYKLSGVNKSKYKKYFKVNRKTGKLTIKKGLKKGTYKIKVQVTAAGNSNYNTSKAKIVKFTIKVK